MQSIGSDIGTTSFCNYNQNQSVGNVSAANNNFIINQQHNQNAVFSDSHKGKYNLNDTMPVNGLGGLSSINIIRQSSVENGL